MGAAPLELSLHPTRWTTIVSTPPFSPPRARPKRLVPARVLPLLHCQQCAWAFRGRARSTVNSRACPWKYPVSSGARASREHGGRQYWGRSVSANFWPELLTRRRCFSNCTLTREISAGFAATRRDRGLSHTPMLTLESGISSVRTCFVLMLWF